MCVCAPERDVRSTGLEWTGMDWTRLDSPPYDENQSIHLTRRRELIRDFKEVREGREGKEGGEGGR